MDLIELLCKEPSASEPPVRSFHMKILGLSSGLSKLEVFGGWPIRLWIFYKLSRRQLKKLWKTDIKHQRAGMEERRGPWDQNFREENELREVSIPLSNINFSFFPPDRDSVLDRSTFLSHIHAL